MTVQLVSKIFDLCDPDPPTSQTDRQTDVDICDRNTALCTKVHRAVISLQIRTFYFLMSLWLKTGTSGFFGVTWGCGHRVRGAPLLTNRCRVAETGWCFRLTRSNALICSHWLNTSIFHIIQAKLLWPAHRRGYHKVFAVQLSVAGHNQYTQGR